MALQPKCNSTLSTEDADCAIDTPHQGICPDGWHIPSDADWTTLTDFVGSSAGKKLRAASGWNTNVNNYEPGTDNYGFSALPGGSGSSSGTFGSNSYGRNYGSWWSASGNYSNAYYREMSNNDGQVRRNDSNKSTLMSVRCVKD